MSDQITYAINDVKSQIASLERHLAILEALPPLPDYVIHIWASVNEVNIFIPFDTEKLQEVRRLLGINFRRVETRTYSDGSKKLYRYEHKAGGFLDIILDPDQAGATCQRVQVGTREEPVYEIRCN